ncbi:hypothetical protein [Avibacterium gallinarum]|nr:hypothetical protein [Avibacterium gallinarum]
MNLTLRLNILSRCKDQNSKMKKLRQKAPHFIFSISQCMADFSHSFSA